MTFLVFDGLPLIKCWVAGLFKTKEKSYDVQLWGAKSLRHSHLCSERRVPCWRYLHWAVLSWRLRSLCQISRRFDANKHFAGVSSLPGRFWVAQTLWNLPHGPARANIWIGILQLSIRKIYNDPTDRGGLGFFISWINHHTFTRIPW